VVIVYTPSFKRGWEMCPLKRKPLTVSHNIPETEKREL